MCIIYATSQSLFTVNNNPLRTFLMQPIFEKVSNADTIIIIAALNRLLIG